LSLLDNMMPEAGDIVVVDGYRFAADLLERLHNDSPRLVVIDDLADKSFPAHVIVNHNIYASVLSYVHNPGSELFLGPQYALVRPEFFRLRECKGDGSVLITLGSGPSAWLGCELAHALRELLPNDIEVVLGSGGAHLPEVPHGMRIHQWVDLHRLMENVSLVICGLGVTFLEVLATGKPVIGVQVAANQALAYRAAKEAGYPVFAGFDAQGIARAAVAVLEKRMPTPQVSFPLDPQGPSRVAGAILGNMS
jgi:spore coat polysaccharide biosynthesis predicted glycosyltransferase SpsG